MAGITLEQAQAKLDNAMAALDAAMTAQEYQAGASQRKRMADLDALQRAVNFWDRKVKALSGGSIRLFQGCPI